MNYSYMVPEKLNQQLISALRANGESRLAELVYTSVFEFNDVGLAYYAGMKGDNWNKHAVDCNMYIQQINLETLKQLKVSLKNWIQRILPAESGLLIRDILLIPSVDDMNISIPEIEGDTWDVLYKDISQALSRNEPALVLDRLHTFSVKFIRELCEKKGIITTDGKGQQYPLHSLAGMLAKHYQKAGSFQSDFSEQALKTSISLFDKYNGIRNDQSYAHDNEILNNSEAMFAVKIMTATVSFIYEHEEKEKTATTVF